MQSSRRAVLRRTAVVASCGIAGTSSVRGRRSIPSSNGEWTTRYDLDRTEYAEATLRTDDAFWLAGRSSEDGEAREYWLLELGPDGRRQTATTFRREENGTVEALCPAPDGVVVAGTDLGPNDDVTAPHRSWAAHVGRDGVEWTHSRDRDEIENDRRVGGVARTSDGDFVLAGTGGTRDGDAWLLRLGPDGSVADERSFDREQTVALEAVTATGDGGVVAGGSIGRIDDATAWLVAVDADGSDRWERTYGDPDGVALAGVREVTTSDDGLALALDGIAGDDAGPTVAAADSDGTLRWTEYLFSSQFTAAEAIAPTEAGSVVGGTFVGTDGDDYWLGTVGSDGES